MKPTVRDIAKEASVSLATVDRVLNARAGVREETISRVKAAIEKIGYVRDLSAANLARQRSYKYVFVLPEGRGQFVNNLEDAISEAEVAQASDRTSVVVQRIPQRDPHAFVQALQALDATTFDGLAIMAPETPQLRDALAGLRAQGVAVVTLVSDLPSSDRDHFVGIDNVAAGRTAAVLMARFLDGSSCKVLVVADSMQHRDSLERRLGFDSVIARDYPAIQVLPTVETHDDPARIADVSGQSAEHQPGYSRRVHSGRRN